MGVRKRCQRGKSCGSTCISQLKICLLELGKIGSNLSTLKDKIFPKKSEKFEFALADYNKIDDLYDGRIDKLKKSGLSNKAAELKREKELAKSRVPEVKKFLSNLEGKLPQGSRLLSDKTNLNIRFLTDSGDKVDVYFSPKKGFHFRVNDQVAIGSVKTKEGQQQVIKAVREIFAAVSSSLPTGAVMKTKAIMDEKGSRRVTLYKRMGFSDPVPPKGWMYAVKEENGKVRPAHPDVFDSYSNSSGTLFFSEFPPNGSQI